MATRHGPAAWRPATQPAQRQPAWKDPRVAIAALLALVAVVWLVRRAQGPEVKNLGSRGSAVIAFGDSLTAGYGAKAGEDYPSFLSAKSGLSVVNAGVSGDTTESAAARLEADVLARDPRIVLVGLGGNDFLRGVPLASTEANLRGIVRRIQQSGAMVVLLGFRFPSITASYEGMYERVAEEEGCLLIPDLLDGIMTDPSLKSDEIHPNARGYGLMAERVAGPLSKLLERAQAAR